ncbi:MAG: dephospho-CoA kinase [Anaerolineales bacterium]|nr:dephospho-CoA kinase [Anaerolineales bacterium]
MSSISGKFIIGLTGNIATGKSVVRRMLEHLGAYTIDADSLAHRAYAKGAPGYQPVVDTFGKWLLTREGEIDRQKLGKLVFGDAEALRKLEDIVHPLVGQAVEMLVKRASQPVVVIEAIKLLEGDLRKICDSIWVANAPEVIQAERLIRKRGFTQEQALERIRSQSSQAQKVGMANKVITNTGSYDDLWKQVNEAWKEVVPGANEAHAETVVIKKPAGGDFSALRGKPKHASSIAELITRLSKGKRKMTPDEVMESFGDKAYMLLQAGEQTVGVAGWQVENLVTRVSDIFMEDNLDLSKALGVLIAGVESASSELQSEASLVFAMERLADQEALWQKIGYEKRTADSLGAQAWQEAAQEAAPVGSALFFKQLRQDRVLRPI